MFFSFFLMANLAEHCYSGFKGVLKEKYDFCLEQEKN